MEDKAYFESALSLLRRLIATPSTSRNEGEAADVMEEAIREYGLEPHRLKNNVWTIAPHWHEGRPTLLLNAHLDTVKPASGWQRDPFKPALEEDRLYGLGSNDCGGGLVSLLQVFRRQAGRPRDFNLIYLASAEEEVSGADGIALALPQLPHIDVALVGEPTGMQPAVAERGLMVLDVTAYGKSGHAARGEGVNAIYKALDDMAWFRDYRFERVSPLLGPTKMTLTVVHAGTQHNVVPDRCDMLVDVRVNELYTNEEVFDIISRHVKSNVHAHSFRLHPSSISLDHPLVARCLELGLKPFGSPTLSDQALMPFTSLKMGPGESSRSHTADEYICLSEIEQALKTYNQLLDGLKLTEQHPGGSTF